MGGILLYLGMDYPKLFPKLYCKPKHGGGLTRIGAKYNELAKKIAWYWDLRRAFYEVYGHYRIHITRIMRNDFLQFRIIDWMRYYMEKDGLDGNHIAGVTNEVVEVLTQKMREAKPAEVPAIAREIKNMLDMYGGDWAGLSNQETRQDYYVGYTQTLRPTKEVKLVEETIEPNEGG